MSIKTFPFPVKCTYIVRGSSNNGVDVTVSAYEAEMVGICYEPRFTDSHPELAGILLSKNGEIDVHPICDIRVHDKDQFKISMAGAK